VPDDEVARRTGRNIIAVVKRRRRLNIPNRFLKRHVWTQHEIALLGKLPDETLAKQLLCPLHVVAFKRKSLQIPAGRAARKRQPLWSPSEIRLLGKMPDTAVAAQTGRSVASVIARRAILRIKLETRQNRLWTPDEEKLLGTRPDNNSMLVIENNIYEMFEFIAGGGYDGGSDRGERARVDGREVDAGRFRDDLFYRLNILNIELPPLRERQEDLPVLVEHFLGRFCRKLNKPVMGLAQEAMDVLRRCRFPGTLEFQSRCSFSPPPLSPTCRP